MFETVAIPVLEETQGFIALAVPEPVSADVFPTQADKVPEMVGSVTTVIVTLCESVAEQLPNATDTNAYVVSAVRFPVFKV